MSTNDPNQGGDNKTIQVIEGASADPLRKTVEPSVASNGVAWLPVPGWQLTGWLWHGFSTRQGGESRVYCVEGAQGELNLGFTTTDERAIVLHNRRLLAGAVTGDEATPLVTARQIHSGLVVVVDVSDAVRPQPYKADGLITNESGILLGIQTADCIPVLVADRKQRVVAAFHAGWRGTVKRIVEAGVGRMRLEFGSQPEDLVAAIGPGIGTCCYSVGEEVVREFESQFSYAAELFRGEDGANAGHSVIGLNPHLDLVEANRRQLLDAGLKAEAIEIVGGCTSCQTELFFSHRAAQGHAGRMMAVIGIRPRPADSGVPSNV